MFFATEVEANYQRPEDKISQKESLMQGREMVLRQKADNNAVVNNQLQVLSAADKYLDMDNRIEQNIQKKKEEIGWAR